MNFPSLMQRRSAKPPVFFAVLLLLCLPEPLFSQQLTTADSLADASKREFVSASLLNMKGASQEAVDRYRKLLQAQPDNAALHYALSRAYVGIGAIDSARVHSEKSVQLNPENSAYAKLFSGISHKMDSYKEAADRYRQLATLEHGAGKEQLLFTLGQIYLQTGQNKLAIETFRELVRDNPRSLPAWLTLFEASVPFANSEAFRQDLLLFYTKSNATLEQQTELARLFVFRASKERAYVEPARQMLAELPKHHPATRRLTMMLQTLEGELFFQTGEPLKAVPVLEKVVRAKRASKEKLIYVQANSTLALCYDQLGQYDKCLRLYEHLLRLDPGNALMMNNLAYIFAVRGKELPRAKALALKAVAKEPTNPSYLDTLGWIFFKMERYNDAKEMLERAVRITSGEVDIIDHLGQVYEKLGDTQKALEMQERLKKMKGE